MQPHSYASARAAQAIKAHVEAEKALLADSLKIGPMAELRSQLHDAEARLAEATGTIQQMRHERQEEAARFEDGLHRWVMRMAEGTLQETDRMHLGDERQAVRQHLWTEVQLVTALSGASTLTPCRLRPWSDAWHSCCRYLHAVALFVLLCMQSSC